jgi:hypothetical protein
MKVFWALGIMAFASSACGVADAATTSYSDFEVISVVPRSPSVKPLVMPIPAKEPNKQLASKGVGPSEAGR